MNFRAVLVLLTRVLCCFCMPLRESGVGTEDMTDAGMEEVGKAVNGLVPDSKSNTESSEDITERSEDISDDIYSSAEKSITDLNETVGPIHPKAWFPKFDSAMAGQIANLTAEIKFFVRTVLEKHGEFASEVGVLLKHVSRSALEFAKIIEDFRGYIKEWDSMLFERVSNAAQMFLDNVENSIFGLLSDIRSSRKHWNRILERTLNDIEERLLKVVDHLIELLTVLTRLIDRHADDMFESLGSILRSLSILLTVSIGISVAILTLLLLFICSKSIDIYSKCTSRNEVKKVDDQGEFTACSSKSLGKFDTKRAPNNIKMEHDVEFTKMDDSTWEEAGEKHGRSMASKTKSGEKVHLRESRDVEFIKMAGTTLQVENTSSVSYEDPIEENRGLIKMDETTLQVKKTSSLSYEDTIQEKENLGSSTANKTKFGEKGQLRKSGDVEFTAMDEMIVQLEKSPSVSYEDTIQGTKEEGPEKSIPEGDAGTADGPDTNSM